ncbi:insulinase family protein [Methylolobus aquaticus]
MKTTHHRFALCEERMIPEIGALARVYRHTVTGTEFVSLINDDENKVFGIAFATPSNDSTGIAHVMEHSVLCGSRRYPLKEPFVELIKASLNTFVNAMTWPDHTVYPVASQHAKDLYNLIDVYLDAVFYPNLTRWTLMQEGWHYELEDPSDALRFKGVVFNEMKGNYSSPDSMLGEYVRRSLFPDTIYGHDSGGDPAVIPDLTYDRFKAFHATFYHPSNARIFFYGDDDPEERLRYLDAWLSGFQAIELTPELPLQPRWPAPRRQVEAYDPGEDAEAPLAYVSVNWLLGELRDPETALTLEILSHMLAGTPASPLRKRLTDSGLGEDVTGGYVDSDCREAYFPIGLKGVDPADVEATEALILDTLRDLAEAGFEAGLIEASLNTVEFNLREANFGGFPRGIAYLIQSLQYWLYDGDPLAPLAFEAPLLALKKKLATSDDPFRQIIREMFVENTHRTTVVMLPDDTWLAQREKAEQRRLEQVAASLSAEELQRLAADTATLKALQTTPDTPDALATVPTLRPGDLEPLIKTIPTEIDIHPTASILYHELPTHGIVYLDLAFDIRGVPTSLTPYLGLFGSALLEMGTERKDFVTLTQSIGGKTGGIGATAINTLRLDTRVGLSLFVLRSKCTATHVEDLLDLLSEILLTARFDDRERFRQIVLEEKAGIESELVPHGNAFAELRLRARLNAADWVAEQTDGISYLFFLRQLAARVDGDWEGVLRDLECVRDTLITAAGLTMNATADTATRMAIQPRLEAFIHLLPSGAAGMSGISRIPEAAYNEGLTVPAQVNFVAKGADVYALGHALHGSWLVVQNWLSTTYLWERVRVRGGAYGGSCRFDPLSGVFMYSSYRDPNLAQTVQIYDRTAEFLRTQPPDRAEVERAIIGVIGSLDRYMLPDAKGYTALRHHLAALNDPLRQQIRDEVLATDLRHFHDFARVLDDVASHGHVVAVGSLQAIEQANAALGGDWLSVTRVL